MKKKLFFFIMFGFAIFVTTSCKKDYQSLSLEFIRNLPDTCEFLTQTNCDTEHLVYYKGIKCDHFFCYVAETDNVEVINCPRVEDFYGSPLYIGAGKENIMIGYTEHDLQGGATVYSNACIQVYNLKTRTFKEFATCNSIEYENGKRQMTCIYLETDRYGDGTRTDEIYDFDGNLLSKKEIEVVDYEEVPPGTLAAREQEALEQERIEQQSVGNYNQPARNLYYCELCGEEYTNVQDLLNNRCLRNKMGSTLGYHKLYEGSIKSVYTCRYCGKEYSSIKDMVFNSCLRRGGGERHVPAQ